MAKQYPGGGYCRSFWYEEIREYLYKKKYSTPMVNQNCVSYRGRGGGGGIRAIWIGTGGGDQSQPNTQFTDRSGNRRSFTEEVFAYSEHVSKSYLLQKFLAGLVPEIFVNVFSLLYPT